MRLKKGCFPKSEETSAR